MRGRGAWPLSAAERKQLQDVYGRNAIVEFTGANLFLSNSYESPVLLDGVEFPTAQHAFQAQKSTDAEERRSFAHVPSTNAVKHLGQSVLNGPHGVGDSWFSGKRDEAMRKVIAAKFAAGTPLTARLLATGDAPLVEGNHRHDTVWGAVPGEPSQNMLGVMLMERRKALMGAAAEPAQAVPAAPTPAKLPPSAPEAPTDVTGEDAEEQPRKKQRAKAHADKKTTTAIAGGVKKAE